MDTPDHQAEIAKRAYALWEREGHPNGRDLDHWLRAEAEINRASDAPLAAKDPPARKRRSKAQAR